MSCVLAATVRDAIADGAAAPGASGPFTSPAAIEPAAPRNTIDDLPVAVMQRAAEQLRGGDVAAALALQQQALVALTACIEQARPAPGEETPAAAQQTAETASSRAARSAATAGFRGPEAAAASTPGSQSSTPGTPLPTERRAHLATAVWGHLPDREREAMRLALDAAFLPEYEDLVADYYESLAEQGLASDPITRPVPEPVP